MHPEVGRKNFISVSEYSAAGVKIGDKERFHTCWTKAEGICFSEISRNNLYQKKKKTHYVLLPM